MSWTLISPINDINLTTYIRYHGNVIVNDTRGPSSFVSYLTYHIHTYFSVTISSNDQVQFTITSQKWLMLQRGWIKFVFCQKTLLKTFAKSQSSQALNLMPTISTMCAFSYVAFGWESPVTNSQISSKWQPEKSALPTLSKYKSLANTIKRHLDFLPNDDSYNIQLKSLQRWNLWSKRMEQGKYKIGQLNVRFLEGAK